MKTLWIMDHYSSEPKYGGIVRQYDFAIELAKRGYKVVIIASSFSHFTHKYISEKNILFSEINKNIHYVYLKTFPYDENNSLKRIKNMVSFVQAIKKNYKNIEQHFGKPDVITGCSVHPLTWIAAYSISKKYNARYCVEVRDLWPIVWIQGGEKSRYHPMCLFFSALEKWAYKKADRVIYSMTYGDRYICDVLGIPKKKVFWVGQPMDCERFDQFSKIKIDLIPKDLQSFIKDSYVCVFAGYYMEYEGVYTMLEAAKNLKEKKYPIKMVFVGSGQEEQGMKDYVKLNNLTNVFIGPRISKEAIPALLKISNICMAQLSHKNNQAYKYGTSKNKVNEYLYSGNCTIFAFSLKNDPVAMSGGGYVIEPNNVEELTNKIIEVYEMPRDKYVKFGDNGKKYINQNHKVEVLADKMEKILFED